MIISVASGKGGTGKTTVSTNFALAISKLESFRVRLLDCDVEEPNAHIFLNPQIKSIKKAYMLVPEIDLEKCDFCGRCKKVCVYNAIAIFKDNVLVFPQLCHACGACSYLCPRKAIKEFPREIGVLEEGQSGNIYFVHGKLNIGEAMAPPLIREVKKYICTNDINIIDAPPGTSCPVIESIKGSDFCILVTEPTPFGLNDLVLAVDVLRKLKIPFGVIVNRSDLGDDKTFNFCKKENIPILMKIPFKKEIARVYSRGGLFVNEFPEYEEKFIGVFEGIRLGKWSL